MLGLVFWIGCNHTNLRATNTKNPTNLRGTTANKDLARFLTG